MKQEVRQHIIKTAADLFYQNGYNSTGINEIISTAGIAKATLYNHFKSKEAICLAYLQYKHAVFSKDIKEFCQVKQNGTPQILAIFDFLSEFFQEKDFNGCWCIKTVSEIPKDNTIIRKEIQEQKQQLIQFITELLDKNNINNANESNYLLAKQLYLLYESAVAESHLHQDNWPIIQAKNIAQKIL